jgi:hypothetical protein
MQNYFLNFENDECQRVRHQHRIVDNLGQKKEGMLCGIPSVEKSKTF